MLEDAMALKLDMAEKTGAYLGNESDLEKVMAKLKANQ
jgi:hypothetical protein